MAFPDVALVVVTYNSARDLPAFLASIPAATAGIEVTVVIADNASSDDTLAVARRDRPDALLVPVGRNGGYAAGINAAMEAAPDAAATLILNPDLVLHPGAVAALLAALEAPGVGISAPKILDEDGALAFSLRRDPTVLRALGEAVLGGHRAGRFASLGETISERSMYEHPATVDWASGAAICVSRACAEAVGPWDESYFLYSEEVDFQLRARDAGFAVRFTPDAVVTHIEGESHVSEQLWTILTLNRLRLYSTRHGRWNTAAYRAAVIVNEGARAAAGRSVHRAALAALLRPGSATHAVGSSAP